MSADPQALVSINSGRTFLSAPIVVAASLVGLAHLPLVAKYSGDLWALPHYQFFPFALLGAACLAYDRLRSPLGEGYKDAPLWAAMGLVGVCVLATAVVLNSPWLGAVASLISLLGFIAMVGGAELVRQILPAWAMLWLAIRIPLNLDFYLIGSLQAVTTQCASRVLDLIGVVHMPSGNIVAIPGQNLLIEEACSGIQSLFSAITTTCFLCLYLRRSTIHALLLLSSTVLWVFAMNALRVVTVTVCAVRWDLAVTEGWRHQALGVVVFLGALLLVLSTDSLLLAFARPAQRSVSGRAVAPPDSAIVAGSAQTVRNGLPVRVWFIVPFVVVGAGQLALAAWARTGNLPERLPRGQLSHLGPDTLPQEWDGWAQTEFSDQRRDRVGSVGEFSHMWAYKKGNLVAIMSIDYPFSGWHNVLDCYGGAGWSLKTKQTESFAVSQGPDASFIEASMFRPAQSTHALLLFAMFDDSLGSIEPVTSFRERMGRRLSQFGTAFTPLRTAVTDDRRGFQCQLFIQKHHTEINADELDEARRLFQHLFGQLIQKTKEALGAGNQEARDPGPEENME